MNPVVKAKWIAALRSGDYKQSRGQLRTTERSDGLGREGYCCLGVLCDVYRKEHGGRFTDNGVHFEALNDTRVGGDYISSASVVAWAGLPVEPDGRVHGFSDLVLRNDAWRQTFSQIADYIEEVL